MCPEFKTAKLKFSTIDLVSDIKTPKFSTLSGVGPMPTPRGTSACTFTSTLVVTGKTLTMKIFACSIGRPT
jgi:hypothetical protein